MFALTTIDNPYNPITDFNNWFNYEVTQGYNTCAYLARTFDVDKLKEMTDAEISLRVEEAIDNIVLSDPLGFYIKVDEDYVPKPVKNLVPADAKVENAPTTLSND